MNSMLKGLLAQSQVEPIQVNRIILHSGVLEIEIDEDEFVIGKAESCDLVIDDRTVADFAATVRLDGGAAWIEVTEFSPVVIIDGRPYKRRALRNGDQLQFGRETWSVRLETSREPKSTNDQGVVSRELLEQEVRDLFELMHWNIPGDGEPKQEVAARHSTSEGIEALLRAALATTREVSVDSRENASDSLRGTDLAEGTEEMPQPEERLHELRTDLDERTRAAQRELEARIESLLNHLGEGAAALRASA